MVQIADAWDGNDSGPIETGVYLSPASADEWRLLLSHTAIEDLDRSWTFTKGLRVIVDDSNERFYGVEFELDVVNYGFAHANTVRVQLGYTEVTVEPVASHLAGKKWWNTQTHPKSRGYFCIPGTRDLRAPPMQETLQDKVDLERTNGNARLTHVFLAVFDPFADPLDGSASYFFRDPGLFPGSPLDLRAAPNIRKLARQVACWAAGPVNVSRFTISPDSEVCACESTWAFEVHLMSALPASPAIRLQIEGAGPGMIEVPLNASDPLAPLTVVGSTIPGWLRFALIDDVGHRSGDEACQKLLVDGGNVVELRWPAGRHFQALAVRLVHR